MWTEFCLELHNHVSYSVNKVLDSTHHPEEDLQPILCEAVDIALTALKNGSLPELNLCKQAGRK